MSTPAIDSLVSALRTATTAVWENQNKAELLVEEFMARGLSGVVVPTDIDGNNYDVTPQNVSDLIGSVDAIKALMATGHATNFAKCIKR